MAQLSDTIESFIKQMLQEEAADLLGVSRSNVSRRIKSILNAYDEKGGQT